MSKTIRTCSPQQLSFLLRGGLWSGFILLQILILSGLVGTLLSLVGDRLGRSIALVIGLMALIGLLVDLCLVVGLLGVQTLSQLQSTQEIDQIEEE